VLGEICDDGSIELVIGLFRNDDTAEYAAFALSRIGKRATKALIKALKDENENVRMHSAMALGALAVESALEPLIGALKDEAELVRCCAAEALGCLNDERAVGPLIGALKDESRFVRRAAAQALSKITDQDFGENHEKWLKWWMR